MCRRVVGRMGVWLGARSERRPFAYTVLPLLVWMGAIYYLSAQSSLPHAPGAWWDLLLKKGAHVAAYAILQVLWWRALKRRCSPRLALGLAVLLSVLYAISDEVHQLYVPGRNGRVWDVVIDVCGVLLAASILRGQRRRE